MRIGERRRQTSDLTPRDATRLETSSREAYQAFLKVELCSPSDKAQSTPGGNLDSTFANNERTWVRIPLPPPKKSDSHLAKKDDPFKWDSCTESGIRTYLKCVLESKVGHTSRGGLQ